MYTLHLENTGDKQSAQLLARLMKLWHDRDISFTTENADISVRRDPSLPEEGFRLVCDGKTATVHGGGTAGVTYGLCALVAHYTSAGFSPVNTTEVPRMPFRGVQLYMPPKENIEDFKRIIDMLAYLKLNTLIIEVGGGMEYKRHPEINKGWEDFCKKMNAYPNGPKAIQGNDVYHKDSLHTELGGGSFVPQEKVRELVDHARGYGINVVPELQMLSHAYYITAVYPEYAERANDFFPDTTCPHNEDAYKLYFDLAEEVIDVFRPTSVSIGHDEIRVLGLCDTCKNYTGHELLAYEINRLHEFYKNKGIKIAMWCEKLQSKQNLFTGKMLGGGRSERVNEFGRKWVIPATHDAIKNIPKDILLLDWLYGWSWESQEEAEQNGFQQIFGNFHGEITRGWERRIASPAVVGGQTSSWCLADEFTLGRDGILGDFWYSAMVLWGAEFDENNHEQYMTKQRKEMPMIREMLQNRQSPSVSLKNAKAQAVYTGIESGQFKITAASLPERGIWPDLKAALPAEMHGAPVGEHELVFPVGHKSKTLVFVHTCLGETKVPKSYRLPITDWCPAVYAIRYADGVTEFAHVRFGLEVGNIDVDFGRKLGYEGKTPEDPHGFGTTANDVPDPPLYELNTEYKNSLLYSAYPFSSSGKVAYMMEWDNPRPDVAIERVFGINCAKVRDDQVVLYCVASVM